MSRCYTPIEIFPKMKKHNGKTQKSSAETPMVVPCGQCIGCRFNRAESWAARMMHEASLHDYNSFITLTYRDDNLPSNGSLAPSDVTLFFKRLRKALKGKKILYYYCGEYGDQFSRPHYHIALFGHDFSSDRIPWRKTPTGEVYRSPMLEKLWTHGHSEIGNLEYDSARYVAGYIQKKINGKQAAEYYTKLNPSTGEITDVHPEFARMSRRPAIGKNWFQEYNTDIYNFDVCVVGNKKLRPPAYYDKLLKKSNEQRFNEIKLSREASMAGSTADHARLTKTYEAKVIASNKQVRSFEGAPAPVPDRDRLSYYKRIHDEYHLGQKENK